MRYSHRAEQLLVYDSPPFDGQVHPPDACRVMRRRPDVAGLRLEDNRGAEKPDPSSLLGAEFTAIGALR